MQLHSCKQNGDKAQVLFCFDEFSLYKYKARVCNAAILFSRSLKKDQDTAAAVSFVKLRCSISARVTGNVLLSFRRDTNR